MAEAHSAVAFSFAITHEGVNVNFDHEVLHLVWASGVRSWKKRIARFKNNVKCGVYPAPLHSLWASIGAVSALHFSGVGVPLHLIQRIIPHLPGDTTSWQITACSVVGMGTWLSVTFSIRYILKMLLMYKGWMYESRGKGSKISLKTKLWLGAVKVLSAGSKPMLYSYQGSLPRLPLPSVHDTIERYLRSVRPILSDDKYKRMEKLGQEFQKGIAVKLQRYLILKSWWSTNYVSDWWEEYVYLRGRSPLMVNSNFYGIDAILMYPTKIQAARAASIIYACLIYRRLIERQELEPILIQNLVPLCSWQYERVFNTTRVPGIETDRIVHYSDSNHIVVIHKGKYYRVTIYAHRRLLTPCEIEQQMTQILNDKSEPAPGEERLASLTAGDRVAWAQARKSFFSRGINRTSLDTIERAAFVVSLDDFPYDFNENEAGCLDRYGRILLHGKGCDRWFDKSFTLCIGSNGRIGFNAEHSWGDAAVMSHLWEYIVSEEASENGADAPVLGHMWEFCLGEDMDNGYRADGHCLGESELIPPAPARLQWNMDEECLTTIAIAYQAAQSLLNDVDLRVNMYTQYGKGFMKKCRVSPDAFIQMALQLAYYRDAGRFSLTYEASMTRLYKEGRTETVRPCTIESSEWVKAMESGDAVSNEEKIRLLQKACQVHQRAYQDAMCGKGIDRHLFCLYVVSKYLEIDSPFLKEVLSEPWRLSTSQTPHGQTSRLDLRKFPKCISAGGGFGPVADDGYGVSYIIAGEDIIFFHISSKRSSPQTDSSRFSKGIECALADIRSLFEKPAAKPAAKPEAKPEVKPAVKLEAKPEVKPEVKAEVKPEIKPEVKPEVQPEVKPEVNSK